MSPQTHDYEVWCMKCQATTVHRQTTSGPDTGNVVTENLECLKCHKVHTRRVKAGQ